MIKNISTMLCQTSQFIDIKNNINLYTRIPLINLPNIGYFDIFQHTKIVTDLFQFEFFCQEMKYKIQK